MTEMAIDFGADDVEAAADDDGGNDTPAGIPSEQRPDYSEEEIPTFKVYPDATIAFSRIVDMSVMYFGDDDFLSMEQNFRTSGMPYPLQVTVENPTLLAGRVWQPADDTDPFEDGRVTGPLTQENITTTDDVARDENGDAIIEDGEPVMETESIRIAPGDEWPCAPADGFWTDTAQFIVSKGAGEWLAKTLDTMGGEDAGYDEDGEYVAGLFEPSPEDTELYDRLVRYPTMRQDMIDRAGALEFHRSEQSWNGNRQTRVALKARTRPEDDTDAKLTTLYPLNATEDAAALPPYEGEGNLVWGGETSAGSASSRGTGADAEPETDTEMSDLGGSGSDSDSAGDATNGHDDSLTWDTLSQFPETEEFVHDVIGKVADTDAVDTVAELEDLAGQTIEEQVEAGQERGEIDVSLEPSEVREMSDTYVGAESGQTTHPWDPSDGTSDNVDLRRKAFVLVELQTKYLRVAPTTNEGADYVVSGVEDPEWVFDRDELRVTDVEMSSVGGVRMYVKYVADEGDEYDDDLDELPEAVVAVSNSDTENVHFHSGRLSLHHHYGDYEHRYVAVGSPTYDTPVAPHMASPHVDEHPVNDARSWYCDRLETPDGEYVDPERFLVGEDE
jgi:hypothetical protein